MLRLILLQLCIAVTLASKSYEGYKVLRMDYVSQEQAERLAELEEDLRELDFWTFPRDLMVPDSLMSWVDDYLKSYEIEYEIWIEDVQELINKVSSTKPRTDVEGFDYYVYHTYEELMDWIDLVVATYPDLAEAFSIGLSHEGRDLKALKIGADLGGHDSEKHSVWFNGAIHAREWISPATVIWMTNALLANYSDGSDPDVTFLMEFYDFFILPVMNPDGYEYSWTDDRMWRKTRSHYPGDECVGTDCNRNFDFEWGGLGASNDSCSNTYRGPVALSEIEVKSVVEFIREESEHHHFDLYIDYHSYSQMMLSPWGYTYDLPVDYDLMEAHMIAHTEAIEAVHGMEYIYGPSATTLYPVSGGSKDWGYGDQGIPYSYTIELRDDGTYGFLLPEDQIYPTVTENYEGLKAGLLHIADLEE
ncbi:carboxypeptidase B-like [Glandiceps talaboti]